jgi:hypothetical protein
MSLYEAAALGVNMSVPYGSWMGSVIQDAFYAPHELCVEIQSFLAGHERLYSRATYSEVGVVYSVRSHSELMSRRDAFADNRTNVSGEVRVPFLDACRALSDARQPYDVVFFPEGELRADALTLADVRHYRTLVLAGCHDLTDAQAALLREYAAAGGRIVEAAEAVDSPQVVVDRAAADFAICVQRVAAGAAVHLVRYDYDEAADAVPPLARLELSVRLPETFSTATAFSPAGDLGVTLSDGEDGLHRLSLTDVPLYGVVLLEP